MGHETRGVRSEEACDQKKKRKRIQVRASSMEHLNLTHNEEKRMDWRHTLNPYITYNGRPTLFLFFSSCESMTSPFFFGHTTFSSGTLVTIPSPWIVFEASIGNIVPSQTKCCSHPIQRTFDWITAWKPQPCSNLPQTPLVAILAMKSSIFLVQVCYKLPNDLIQFWTFKLINKIASRVFNIIRYWGERERVLI